MTEASAGSNARDLIYNNIDRIMANAQRFRAEGSVSLDHLLDDDFMAKHSRLPSLAEMFALAGEAEVSEQALARIPDDLWDRIVRETSDFATWPEMFSAASQDLVRRRLLEGCAP
ncbi:hypothetical protein CLV78_1127 [Aliiruegeria haliotis]|uniref:Uncharacterized protein n=1 Tax=Aliiruegeria haliotis TaxID=1280846 RepID=A0A2T0RHF0_9RHOB|nr:hypothetical protein [Aliiruegeria haliotis]PRY20634.1 hypothetical protein CLV78_1127 [Aliiruegeria haliotis]